MNTQTIGALPDDLARAKLSAVFDRMMSVSLVPSDPACVHLDPVEVSAREVRAKLHKNPGDLWHSSKLFRAIDNIESTAYLMPAYATKRHQLAQIVAELRRLSGWTSAD